MDVLTREQVQSYEENGYLLASGLIPDEVSLAAEAAMWRILNVSPNETVIWEDQHSRHSHFDGPELTACYTPAFLEAAKTLAEQEGDEGGEFLAPDRPYAINVFPVQGEWSWPGPHIDHAIKSHGHKTFPRAFRIATMTFLNDVPPHGGGTVVWPGGHRKLRALAESDPERYEMMWRLNEELDRADLGDPVELTPRRGDVLFYHYLCPHAGSRNVSDRPRFALNMKW